MKNNKAYVAPKVEVVTIEIEDALLVGSEFTSNSNSAFLEDLTSSDSRF